MREHGPGGQSVASGHLPDQISRGSMILGRSGFNTLLLLILAGTLAGRQQEIPKASLRDPGFDFGKVVRGRIVEHGYTITNDGSAPLNVVRVHMTPPLVATVIPSPICPGCRGTIRIRLDTTKLEGPFEGRIVVVLNDPSMAEIQLTFLGEILAPIEVSPLPAFFITAGRGETKAQSVEIINHGAEPLQLCGGVPAQERFETEVLTLEAGQRYRLTLRFKADGRPGKHTDLIMLRTSSKSVPVLRIPVNTYIRERVYTFPDQVDFGALPINALRMNPAAAERLAQHLMVYQSAGSDLQAQFSSDLPFLRIEAERGPKGDRFQVTLDLIVSGLREGRFSGTIVIRTNDPECPQISVPVTGSILNR